MTSTNGEAAKGRSPKPGQEGVESDWNPTMNKGQAPGLTLAAALSIRDHFIKEFGPFTSQYNADAVIVLAAAYESLLTELEQSRRLLDESSKELSALRAAVQEWDLAMQAECAVCDRHVEKATCECIEILNRLGVAQDQLRSLAKIKPGLEK